MKLLSRTEELLLNCIFRLQEDAFTFMIREKLKEGLKALSEIRKIDRSMWEDLPVSIYDRK